MCVPCQVHRLKALPSILCAPKRVEQNEKCTENMRRASHVGNLNGISIRKTVELKEEERKLFQTSQSTGEIRFCR